MTRGTQTILLAVVAIVATIAISHAATRSPVGSRRSAGASAGWTGVKSDAGLPASYVNHISEPGVLVSGYGLRPTLARRVKIGTAERVWVVPGRTGACLVVLASGDPLDFGCGSLARVKAGGLIMVRRLRTGPVVDGLVSKGAAVTVTDSDGKSISVPVRHGVYTFDGGVRSVTVRAADGRATTTAVK